MGLAEKPHADGQALRVAQLFLHPAKGPQVVGHLFHIVGILDFETRFFVKQINECGLRAFDLEIELLDLFAELRLLAVARRPTHLEQSLPQVA